MKKTSLLVFCLLFALIVQSQSLRLGAERTAIYLPQLEGKVVGLVGNQTSRIGNIHLVDTLLSLGVNLKTIFSPEHGFRGDVEAGAHIQHGKDVRTGLPIVSLYGRNKKPSKEQVAGLDVIIFDLQDVGTRFYTYISTLHYVMEICAEQGIPLIVLDRPNPNGHFMDGPILEKKHTSFVGMHPIPVVHGMTIGEYAQMINGEKWLPNGIQCPLFVVEMENYNRNEPYDLPVPPSPNLPTSQAIALYPSLCFFEGTNVSLGRGTETPFEIFGSPEFKGKGLTFTFTPQIIKGKSENPPFKNQLCYGVDLSQIPYDSIRNEGRINLSYLIQAYQLSTDKSKFFNNFFEKLAGTDSLRRQIIAGISEEEIRKAWQSDLEQFAEMRKPYLLYE
ncbi:MAG: DUF1343 domain-containing protein [Bacteroidales bacterium]|jgi:uncharacterized protein YbbC (DUF1343 family)|nr:DUF1343 domain-containing protein [Bacteroidales bacterium]